MSKAMTHTIRLTDPGQPSRVYGAAGTTDSVKREARKLGRGVLSGGTVQVYAGAPESLRGDEEPIAAWVVK